VVVGADVVLVVVVDGFEEPVLSDVVVEPLVVVVVLWPVEREVLPLDVVDVGSADEGALEPGCWRATTAAITAVAPVAARTIPRVRRRSRDCALDLVSGLFASGGRDIDQQPLLAERRHPNTPASIPPPGALCASCDIARA
jgi:hypothetical protein